jgi:hypothetical protein
MTSEIAIMNTGGVALAADSAVTISGVQKVYHSARKLFKLSDAHAVGIMIYGNASFLDVPWESIIEVYRKHMGDKCFDTLEAYTKSFFDFLHENDYPDLMSKSSERNFLTNGLESEVINLHKALADIKNDLFSEYGELHLQQEIQDMYMYQVGEFLQNSVNDYTEKSHIGAINEDDFNMLAEKYGLDIEKMIEKHFEPYNYIAEWVGSIKIIVINVLLKEFSSKFSGIVFTGFGEKEIYPSFFLFLVDGSINQKVKFWNTPKSKSINHDRKASIIPLAQRDMVNSFFEGIHPEMEKLVKNNLKKNAQLLQHSFNKIIDSQFAGKVDMETVKEEIKVEILHLYDDHVKTMINFKQEQFIDPMMAIVENLPKEELAEMAETLIHLTSFKNRLSTDVESVGGPVDSAVITKADGFVWVRNKTE